MDDNSTHTTNMCKTCASSLSIDELNLTYQADILNLKMNHPPYDKRKALSYKVIGA